MTDLVLLKKYISECGLSLDGLADSCGITKNRLLLLLSGKVEFRASEMVSLRRVLCLSGEESESIFFNTDS